MEKGFVENGFIIDLSNTKNTTQLVFELSSVMEHPEVKGKRICLKLGSQDLKQSQLLSIKALIESMDAEIAFIDTTSEQTEASAVSLGIIISKLGENVEVASYTASEQEIEEETVEVKEEALEQGSVEYEEKTVEVHAEIEREDVELISTIEGIEDTYTEETTQEISEIIPVEHFETDFESLAKSEGLITNEEMSKYIILDTGDVLPEGTEENTVDTKTLPTLYLNQTLRSGQTVNYEGNILIIGDAHPGSEIIADGDITVWGILGGIAHAGSKGNITAKVRALKLNAIQLRIAGLYARRNDTLNVPYVQKTNEFTPEEAQIEEGKIVIYKKLRRD
ncbi:septum site-determining protein MinC [bacterium]|nr:septum site-determining protein MinC [bacterium]